MKILVPIDGSKYSMEGVKAASEYAKTKDAEIHLITVTPFVPGMDLEISARAMDSLNKSMKKRAEDTLDQAQKILGKAGVAAKTTIASSISAADEIIGVAEKEKTDLIIIGSRGLGGKATRFFMGSVASKVVNHAPCSVLVVRTG
ncbi:MAG: universal stress protein [Thermodesulfovibrionales bacterium]|nr:universal stress protein [Thermodesulfovibrionales bacterium]